MNGDPQEVPNSKTNPRAYAWYQIGIADGERSEPRYHPPDEEWLVTPYQNGVRAAYRVYHPGRSLPWAPSPSTPSPSY